MILIVLLILLALWGDLPGWLSDLVTERATSSRYC
jgi:hypothetical protein